MLSQNSIKYIRSLRIKKYRKIHNEFIAEGTKLVLDLLESSLIIMSLYATEDWISAYATKPGSISIQPQVVTKKELERISTLSTPGDVLAVVQIPEYIFDPEIPGKELVLMLEDINDPGNLGTIIRSADWFGFNHIICSQDSVDLFNPKTIQATMGSIARVKVYYENLQDVLNNITGEIPVYGTVLDGEDITTMSIKNNGLIILGNESRGLSDDILKFVKSRISIPPYNISKIKSSHAESLNVAMASTLICFVFRHKNH